MCNEAALETFLITKNFGRSAGGAAALGLRPVAAAALIHLCRWWWWDPVVGGRKRPAPLASLLPPRSHHRSQVQPLISHRRKPCFRKMAAMELMLYYGAPLTVSALLLKRLHLRGHDLSGHTHTATHANGTASNGPDGASSVAPCNIVQRDTGPQSVICSCQAQHLCMSHPNSQHPEGHQPSAPLGFIQQGG